MFDIKSNGNVLEVFYSNSIFYYRFLGINMPKTNPVRKGFKSKVYDEIIDVEIRRINESIKSEFAYETLKKSGMSLYNQLIPDELDKLLKLKCNTLTIVSENNEIPWEILHDGVEFLGIKYSMGRCIVWNDNIKLYEDFIINENRCLIISNPTEDLVESDKETEVLMKFLRKKGIKCSYLSGESIDIDEILNELDNCKYNFIHYSGHIEIDKKTNEYSFLLANDVYFPINGIKHLNFGNPFVFLNGCSSGKIDVIEYDKEIQTRFEGAAVPFISVGASGVLGTLFKVSDSGARRFSELFYSDILNGVTIGEALSKTRRRMLYNENCDDNAWASFVYYGQPELYYVTSPDILTMTKKDQTIHPFYFKEINNKSKKSVVDSIKVDRTSIQGKEIKKNIFPNNMIYLNDEYVNENLVDKALIESFKKSIYYSKDKKVTTTHLFLGILMNRDSNLSNVLNLISGRSNEIEEFLLKLVGIQENKYDSVNINKIYKDKFTKNTDTVIQKAFANAKGMDKIVDNKDILEVLLSNFCSITIILDKFDIDISLIKEKIGE